MIEERPMTDIISEKLTLQQQRGQQAEELALAFMRNDDLVLVCRNYHCRFGEIDLIMYDRNEQSDDFKGLLIFVEVRQRSSDAFGSGADSIDRHKQAKLRKAAEHYLANVHQRSNQACRFDVISIDGGLRLHNVRWLKDAF